MTAREEISLLSARLGLMDESQDWGIVNGSSERFEEFMRIYRDDHLTPAQQSAMAGLVLASANERRDVDARASLEEFAELLPRITADNAWELDYWRGLDGPEVPLGDWLRRHAP
jgi:hypothetical protein